MAASDQPAELLNVRDTAKTLAISERLLWRLARDGQIWCVRIGRSVRFRRGDVLAFIDDRSGRAPAPVLA